MGEDIRLKSAAGEIGAYLATPKGTPKGGIVVIQEIFGVNHHIRAVTDKFAADGYIALAPALLRPHQARHRARLHARHHRRGPRAT